MYEPPRPSRYEKLEASMPTLPDPVLQDCLKEALTYKESTSLAREWQMYTQMKYPSNRELGSIHQGHTTKINIDYDQLCLLFSQISGPLFATLVWVSIR